MGSLGEWRPRVRARSARETERGSGEWKLSTMRVRRALEAVATTQAPVFGVRKRRGVFSRAWRMALERDSSQRRAVRPMLEAMAATESNGSVSRVASGAGVEVGDGETPGHSRQVAMKEMASLGECAAGWEAGSGAAMG